MERPRKPILSDHYFMKGPEAYVIPSQVGSTVAEALITKFFCFFRIPQELHYDQGRNFESHLKQDVLQCLRVS